MASFYIVHFIGFKKYPILQPFNDYVAAIVIFLFTTIISMLFRKVSASKRLVNLFDIIKEIFICYLFGLFILVLSFYAFKTPHYSRTYLLGSISISYIFVMSFYVANSLLYRQMRIHGFNYKNILLVGNKNTLSEFIKRIKNNKDLGLHIAGVMTLGEGGEPPPKEYIYHGSVSHIKKVLNAEVIDYVIFTVYKEDPDAVEKAIIACQERGIEVWLKPDFVEKIMLSQVDYLEDIPVFVFSVSPKNEFALTIKRLFDIVISSFGLILMSIPMIIVAVIVQNTSKGSAIFKQKRIGLNGRKFIMYKFRTMYTDLQQRRAEHKLKNEMQGPVFKMKKDPRITPVGFFLRKYSLDELPQLWNVLIGDMSLVGPRPPLPSEVYLYKGWHRRRLSMRPGITCIWQIAGRNNICDFNEWVKLDLKYIDTWNLWLDVQILFKTIPVVIFGTGC